jgi:hypothetical protein
VSHQSASKSILPLQHRQSGKTPAKYLSSCGEQGRGLRLNVTRLRSLLKPFSGYCARPIERTCELASDCSRRVSIVTQVRRKNYGVSKVACAPYTPKGCFKAVHDIAR